ncbi:sigma-70 family RNA polymerase sigma factor [Marinihelvus fidelis]|uniref:Sigma-70 family RNA polymerase sigma factor n=1 Tax=Marinihelvus fidelis TaxID=2613842 RepID=A0A5N0TAF4_9GAMM|nr:sigma-70 family RNA polymerase sigma factor [Marinihelvus fidelis]KAA9131920.1 sigma-70 family RNA polymerase sigma factor [Marinihelvus fidelis]
MTGPGFDMDIDEITLAAARQGDLGACERIYRQFHAPAFNVAARVLNCRELARDVVQEAFITAFRRIGQFRGDAPFWGWLKRVVVNHAISALRRQPSAEVVTFEDYRASDEGDQERMGQAMDLEQALAKLGPEDRTIVWLYDVEGFRHEEIAEQFGMTVSFSKTRLARARKTLRQLIGKQDTGASAGLTQASTGISQ